MPKETTTMISVFHKTIAGQEFKITRRYSSPNRRGSTVRTVAGKRVNFADFHKALSEALEKQNYVNAVQPPQDARSLGEILTALGGRDRAHA